MVVLCLFLHRGKLTVFTVLCEQYQPSLKRDPMYNEVSSLNPLRCPLAMSYFTVVRHGGLVLPSKPNGKPQNLKNQSALGGGIISS